MVFNHFFFFFSIIIYYFYFAKIKFVTGNTAIAKILSSDEYMAEIKNPESDVHYLSEDPSKIDID